MKVSTTFTAALLSAVFVSPAQAHEGRRFQVQVNAEGQLVAQGVNTGADDGAPAIRPYLNAIHGHWANFRTSSAASADLPSFDLFDPPAQIEGADLTLTLSDAFKWVAPPMMPPAGTTPAFEALGADETIFVTYSGNTLTTNALGESLTLLDPVPVGGQGDLDLSYEIGLQPDNVIYVLEFTLDSSAAHVIESDPVYAILLPEGQLHHAGLFTERYLGTSVPEPGSLAILAVMGVAVGTRRR